MSTYIHISSTIDLEERRWMVHIMLLWIEKRISGGQADFDYDNIVQEGGSRRSGSSAFLWGEVFGSRWGSKGCYRDCVREMIQKIPDFLDHVKQEVRMVAFSGQAAGAGHPLFAFRRGLSVKIPTFPVDQPPWLCRYHEKKPLQAPPAQSRLDSGRSQASFAQSEMNPTTRPKTSMGGPPSLMGSGMNPSTRPKTPIGVHPSSMGSGMYPATRPKTPIGVHPSLMGSGTHPTIRSYTPTLSGHPTSLGDAPEPPVLNIHQLIQRSNREQAGTHQYPASSLPYVPDERGRSRIAATRNVMRSSHTRNRSMSPASTRSSSQWHLTDSPIPAPTELMQHSSSRLHQGSSASRGSAFYHANNPDGMLSETDSWFVDNAPPSFTSWPGPNSSGGVIPARMTPGPTSRGRSSPAPKRPGEHTMYSTGNLQFVPLHRRGAVEML